MWGNVTGRRSSHRPIGRRQYAVQKMSTIDKSTFNSVGQNFVLSPGLTVRSKDHRKFSGRAHIRVPLSKFKHPLSQDEIVRPATGAAFVISQHRRHFSWFPGPLDKVAVKLKSPARPR